MKTAALIPLLLLSPGAFANPFSRGDKIICSELKEQKILTIEILNPIRQLANLGYIIGGNQVFDGEGAYASSGAGFDFALVRAGRPIVTLLVTSDLKTAYVPRNGATLECTLASDGNSN